MTTKSIFLSASAVVAVLLSATSPLAAWGNGNGGCTETWGVYTAITTPTITNPTQSNNGCGINAEVSFTCSASTDQDGHKLADCTITHP